MTDLLEEYAQKMAKKAAEATAQETNYKKSVEMALSLLDDGMSVEFAAKHSKLSLEEVRALSEKRSA